MAGNVHPPSHTRLHAVAPPLFPEDTAMRNPERRQDKGPTALELQEHLTEPQRTMVRELEHFGWDLRFVRHSPSQPPVPVLFSEDDVYLFLRPDGTMDESPDIDIRH
jgi:hypothetical protein